MTEHCTNKLGALLWYSHLMLRIKLLLNICCINSCCSVDRSCLILSMDCSTSGLPVLHYLLAFARIHAHWVCDAVCVCVCVCVCVYNFLFQSLNFKIYIYIYIYVYMWTSLVVQWLRIWLSMQGSRVRSLFQKDSTCHQITKPMHHNYWVRVP